jgi:hypothetical protein
MLPSVIEAIGSERDYEQRDMRASEPRHDRLRPRQAAQMQGFGKLGAIG